MTLLQNIGLVLGAICLLALLSTYLLYPAVMGLLAAVRTRAWRRDETHLPPVTMVVAAYNEEGLIEEKVRNFLAIDYPPERLSLAVGSDGSSDRTDEILRRLVEMQFSRQDYGL